MARSQVRGSQLLDDTITELDVDWGSGTDQIDATSIPLDTGGTYGGIATNVQDALEEIESSISGPISQIVTVAISGGDYTTHTLAIAGITDAGINKRYLILSYPGTYNESIDLTGKPYISIYGVSGKTSPIRITNSSGTALIFDNGSNSHVHNLSFEISGGNAVECPSTATTQKYYLENCTFKFDAQDTNCDLIDIQGGELYVNNCYIDYNETYSVGTAGDHIAFKIAGDSKLIVNNCIIEMDVSDDDGSIHVVYDVSDTNDIRIKNCPKIYIHSLNSAFNGNCNLYTSYGLGNNHYVENNNIFIEGTSDSGDGYAYFLQAASSSSVNSQNNRIIISSFNNNRKANVAASNTLNCHFDKISAPNIDINSGTINEVISRIDGGLYISGNFQVDGSVTDDFSCSANILMQSGKELQFWDVGNSNYVGFEAPALTANQIWVLPATDGTIGQLLKTDGSGNLGWVSAGAGSGDVVGPASATDHAIVRFDLTTGKLIQNSSVTIDDAGTINIPSGQTYNINGSQISSANLSNNANLLKADGTVALSADWDAGGYEIRSATFESDIITGTPPFTIASTTVVTNLNVDMVDGKHVSGANGAGEIVTCDGTQTLTNKTITSPDINGGTADALTSLSIANDVDVGNYKIRALGFLADGMTSGRVAFYTTNGELTGDADLTFVTDTLTATKIGAFIAAGDIDMAAENVGFDFYDNGNSGTSKTISWLNGMKQKITMTGNCVFTFTSPTKPGHYFLRVIQDGTGSRTATWPATCRAPSGFLTLTTTASAYDDVGIFYDGTNFDMVITRNFTTIT